jgi:predicted secreted protein
MGPITSIALFFTVWWTVLFVVLPLGNVTHAEAGIDKGDGGDPGAPVNPNLKRKFFTTTWVAAIVFAVIWVVIRLGLITLPALPSGY